MNIIILLALGFDKYLIKDILMFYQQRFAKCTVTKM